MLIEVFPDKLEAISDLSDAEKSSYIDQNNHSVKNYVIPAYQSLIDGLNALKGNGTNDNGLYYFDHGKEYYEYLIKTKTGSSKSPDELIEWLDDTLKSSMLQMVVLISSDENCLINWIETWILLSAIRRTSFLPFKRSERQFPRCCHRSIYP